MTHFDKNEANPMYVEIPYEGRSLAQGEKFTLVCIIALRYESKSIV
jgi:hypothetical protein